MTPPTTLNRDGIIEAALGLTRAEGLDAVTMRAVAARFDVTPMALYRHIADREELTRLVADRVGSLVRPANGPDDPWDERARAWARAQRAVLRRHRGLAAWLLDNGPAGPEAYRLLDLLASAVAGAGLDDTGTARGTALIMSWTFSRIAVEDNADRRRRARRPSRSQAFVDGLAGTDPLRHPTAARIGAEFFTLPKEEIFEAGLDAIIAGIKST
ncbi:TetR/AcrR family transcriptional regulator [Actinomadura sp. KC345]|uniref:TetR/AcrR family transcriptional regulator n=1 Tax=Actinomadura sp. KC345 TaxID=2530371 RepID=UPI0010506BC3|nr:TetR/AcrR family transcriptional regulator [Actinomadura sp. KC345]TDC55948.1 TetR/AcrR family transcriptional regulator [Actinomadura sp. KC345]